MALLRRGGRECRFGTVFFAGLVVTAQQAQRRSRHVLRRETEVLQNLFAGGRGAVVIDPDDCPFIAGPALPTERRSSLDGDSFLYRFWEDALAISVILVRK